MAPLVSMAPEVVKEILCNCGSINDALNLSATCQRARIVWNTWTQTILCRVASGTIRHYGLALPAIRATNMIADAVAAGILPPSVSPGDSWLYRPGPTQAEFMQLHDLEKLADHVKECILRRLSCGEATGTGSVIPSDPFGVPSSSCTGLMMLLVAWDDRVHRALYRLLLLGAAFACARNGPDPATKAHQTGAAICETNNGRGLPSNLRLPSKSGEQQPREAACDELQGKRYSGDSLHPEWIRWFRQSFEDGLNRRSRVERRDNASTESFTGDEIAAISLVFDDLRSLIINPDGTNRRSCQRVFEPAYRGRRRLPLVLLGNTEPELIYLPPIVGDLSRPWLLSEPIRSPHEQQRRPHSPRQVGTRAVNQVPDSDDETLVLSPMSATEEAVLISIGPAEHYTSERLAETRSRLTQGASELIPFNTLNGLTYVNPFDCEFDEDSSSPMAPFGFMFDMACPEEDI